MRSRRLTSKLWLVLAISLVQLTALEAWWQRKRQRPVAEILLPEQQYLNTGPTHDGDETCYMGFCWSSDSLDALKTAVKAYLHPRYGIGPAQDKQFVENFFASLVGGGKWVEPGYWIGGDGSRMGWGNENLKDHGQHYVAALSLLLSSSFTNKMLLTSHELLVSAALSEQWIYEPYPGCLVLSGAGLSAANGNYSLWSRGEGMEKVAYKLEGRRSDFVLSWDSAHHVKRQHSATGSRMSGCWVLTEHSVKKGKDHPDTAGIIIRPSPNSTSLEIELSAERELMPSDNPRQRILYQNCEMGDMVPLNGWSSVKAKGPAPSILPCGTPDREEPEDETFPTVQGLEILAFRRRTGDGIQWSLLKEKSCRRRKRSWFRGEKEEFQMGYLVFRGTADIHDVLTDISIAKVHWLSEEGPSWGIWSTLHSEVRASIAQIRNEVKRCNLKQLILAGHSLGGSYATEVARLLLDDPSMRHLSIRVVTFGSAAIYTRRSGDDCHREVMWQKPSTGFEAIAELISRVRGRRRCRAQNDQSMRRLDKISLNIINRWDLVPRFHLLPQMLKQEGSRGLVQAFARHFTSRFGAYAARFGAYLTDVLAIPHNLNRTIQEKRDLLEQYQPLGKYLVIPPGVLCDFEQVEATSQLPGTQRSAQPRKFDPNQDSGHYLNTTWKVNVEEETQAGFDKLLPSMLRDHSKYLGSVHAYLVMVQVFRDACTKEFNVTCEELVKQAGVLGGAIPTQKQIHFVHEWVVNQKFKSREKARLQAVQEGSRLATMTVTVEEDWEDNFEWEGLTSDAAVLGCMCSYRSTDARKVGPTTQQIESPELGVNELLEKASVAGSSNSIEGLRDPDMEHQPMGRAESEIRSSGDSSQLMEELESLLEASSIPIIFS